MSKIPQSFIDKFPLLFKKAESLSEPQKETEKVLIPEDGEVNLKNPNVIVDSLDISELRTKEEFTRSEDQTFGKGYYFVVPEENTVFFSPEDAGRRVKIDYLWQEEPPEESDAPKGDYEDEEDVGEHDSEGEVEELDLGGGGGDTTDSTEKKEKGYTPPPKGDWHLDSSWFHWEPLTAEVQVNNSLKVKLAKNLDLQQGFKVVDKGTGKELRTKVTGLKNEVPTNMPGPGEVAYSYSDGFLHFGSPEDSGKTFHVEYFIPGKNQKKLYLKDKKKEYELLEGVKGQAQNLWTTILDHPDPSFVSDHILPLIETEVEHLRDKAKDKDGADTLPDSGDFIQFEHLLAKRETDDTEQNKKDTLSFIKTTLAPKLTQLYSLASLISERVYELQSEEEPDEDFPDFIGSGSRSLDRKTLQYTKNVRQTANKLDREVLDFSKYFMDFLNEIILNGSTYFRGTKKVPFSTVKSVFEKAGVTLDDLQAVALESFRETVLAFDREKRGEGIQDPMDFRIMGNPYVRNKIVNDLHSFFTKYKSEQQVEDVSRSGSILVEIPKGGGVVSLTGDDGSPIVGFRPDSLKVSKSDSGLNRELLFTSATGTEFVAKSHPKFKRLAFINLGKKFSSEAKMTVSSMSGKKLERVVGSWTDIKKEMEDENSFHLLNSFYFSPTTGNIYLSGNLVGVSFLLDSPSLPAGGGGVIGKNQYKADPGKGTLEFSAQNGGDVVSVHFDQSIKAKRFVSPSGSGGDEDEEELSPLDLVGDEGADPESMAEAIDKQEQMEKFLSVVQDILLEEKDPRLDKKLRAILIGVLGFGPTGKRMTEEEIAVRPPFSYDKTESGFKSNLSTLKAKRSEAESVLATILTEKAGDDKSLRSALRPFSSMYLKNKAQLTQDPFLSYLVNPKTNPDHVTGFQRVLDSYLVKGQAKLTDDEENILRWVWAVPGGGTLPVGMLPAKDVGERLREVAVDSFGIPADEDMDPEDLAIVREGYATAIKKFDASFREVFKKNRKVFQEKYYDFAVFYDAQTGKRSLLDELQAIENNETLVPSNPKKKAPKAPLFEQIKKIFPKAPPDHLKALMTELSAAGKNGESIASLISQREEELKLLREKGQKYLDKTISPLKKEADELRKALKNTEAQIEDLESEVRTLTQERETIKEKALTEINPTDAKEIAALEKKSSLLSELISALKTNSVKDVFRPVDTSLIDDEAEIASAEWKESALEDYVYLKDVKPEDAESEEGNLQDEVTELQEKIQAIKSKSLDLADGNTRKSLRQLQEQLDVLQENTSKFKVLRRSQEVALNDKRKEIQKVTEPFQLKLEENLKGRDASKELDTLNKVQDFLSDREDLKRSDGTVDVENMFGTPKYVKGPGYVPPKFAPGEEDKYIPNPQEFKEKAKVSPSKTDLDPNLNTFNLKSPEGTDKGTKTDLSPDEVKDMKDKVKFAPTKKDPSTNTNRSLADELRSVALRYDPEETKKAWGKRIRNFDILLRGLQKHFAKGESIVTFRPSFSAENTLPNQKEVILAIDEYLLKNGDNIKVSPGVWNLKDMYKISIDRPVEDFTVIPKKDSEEDVEALFNAQASLTSKDMAWTLHRLIQVVNAGKSLTDIMKKFKASKASDATASLDIAKRLQVFQSWHSDLKNEDGSLDFSSLYDGTHKFPSTAEANASKPITEQVLPLVKSIQKQLLEDAAQKKKESKDPNFVTPGIESEASTQARVFDMLERMSDMASKNKTLDEMSEVFLEMDKKGAREYSLGHLFQTLKNYLSRLNRTVGLANMSDDFGLSKVFGEGAPAGTPSEQDEIKPTKVDSLPSRTPSFQTMVKSLGMDKAAQEIAYKIIMKVQLAEAENIPAAVTFTNISKQHENFVPVVRQILTYIGKNQPEFNSGVPAFPDFSSLTGIPFSNPAQFDKPEETVAPLEQTLKSKPPVPSDKERDKLRKTIFDDMVTSFDLDDDQKNIFSDALTILKMLPLHNFQMKTEDTPFAHMAELIAQFWIEKGLVNSRHEPDFRAVTLPLRKGRPPFFENDGSPNHKLLKKTEPDFNVDEIASDMPEPSAISTEEEDEFSAILEEGEKSPELQEAQEFLTSDQVKPVEGKEPSQRPTAVARLQRNMWSMINQEYGFDGDEEERDTVLAFLREVQRRGVDAVLKNLKGNALSSADSIISYMRDQGLNKKDMRGVVLPELEKEEVKQDAPVSAPPTPRQEIGDETIRKLLPLIQNQTQEDGNFNVADFVRRLEGKATPDTAKNILMEAMSSGYISLTSGSYEEKDLPFLPVTEDGKVLSEGKFLKMPLPPAAPIAPAAPAAAKGRLPKELGTKKITQPIVDFVATNSGLSSDDILTLSAQFDLVGSTYNQLAANAKTESSRVIKQLLLKYMDGLVRYLRLVGAGQDPIAPPAPPAAAPAFDEKVMFKQLYDKSLNFCLQHNFPTDASFKVVLKKGRPELLSFYESNVSPKVQEALDISNSSDSVDFSDL